MRRVFWISLGIGLGAVGAVLVVRMLNEKAQALTPQGMVDRAGQLVETLREVGGQIAEAAQSRESEIRAGLLAQDPDSPRPSRGAAPSSDPDEDDFF